MPRSNRQNRRTRKQRGGILEFVTNLFKSKSPLSSTASNGSQGNLYNNSAKYQVGNANTMVKLNSGVLNRPHGGRRRRTCRRNNRRTCRRNRR
jgi:hypothetical protein